MSFFSQVANELSSWFSPRPDRNEPVSVPLPDDYQDPYANLYVNPMYHAPIDDLPQAKLPKELWTPEQKEEQLAKERAEYDKALADGDVEKVRQMARQIFEDQQEKNVYNDMTDAEFKKYLEAKSKFQDDAVGQAERNGDKRFADSPGALAARKTEEDRRRKADAEERARLKAKMTPLG
jgi:hypothetical protein